MEYTITKGTRANAHEVYFDAKPDEQTRNALKALKMRWNGQKACWYGFVTEDAIKNAINGACAQTSAKAETIEEALKDYYTIDTTATDGYMGASAFRGSQPQHLYGAELSKAIRQAFKRCGVHGVSVKSKTFSGGQEIGITVHIEDGDIYTKDDYINAFDMYGREWIELPDGKNIHHTEYFALNKEEQERIKTACATKNYDYFIEDINGYGYQLNHYHYSKDKHFTAQFAKRFEVIHRIVNAFNSDSSNSMVDYYSRGFYDFYTVKA